MNNSIKKIDADKHINYWVKNSDSDFKTMLILYRSKNYNWSLFIGHIVIEKLLKGLFIKRNNMHPPYIHNLLRLAELSGIELTEERKLFFATVTTFNINARYEDYKMEFHKICTNKFTNEWIEKIKEYRVWIKKML